MKSLLESSKTHVSNVLSKGLDLQSNINTVAVEDCGTTITPACIKAIYNITDGTLSDKSNSLGIFEFGDVYAQEDLDAFFKTYATNIPSGTGPAAAFVDGATAPTTQAQAGIESDLDFEMAYREYSVL